MLRAIAGISMLLCGACWSADVTVFWASDPVEPDDTVMVCGDGFGASPVVKLSRLTEEEAEQAAEGAEEAAGFVARGTSIEPLHSSEETLKFVIPADWEPGPYIFSVVDGEVQSDPVYLNFPRVYWVQGDMGEEASRGGWVRAFGRCIQMEGGTARVGLKRDGGEGMRYVEVDEERTNAWSVCARLPDDMAPGDWQVVVDSGMAIMPARHAPRMIRIRNAEQWPNDVFNVVDFGASGVGRVNDGAAVRAALERAEENGGGIVYFPRGMYFINGTLQIPRYTVLRGEETALVSLFWPDTDEPYTLVRGTNHFGLEDLTIYASNYKHCIAVDVGKEDSGHTFLRRVRVRADVYMGHLRPDEVNARLKEHLRLSTGGGDTVRLGGEDIEITDCDLYGSGRCLYLLRVRGGYVAGNELYNGRWGWYCLDGSDRLIFENNELAGADLMSTGGGINCLSSSYSQNVYFADNAIEKTHGWDREAMTSDGSGGAYYGKVAEAAGKRLVLADEPSWRGGRDWIGAGVFIMGGKGMGQYRRVAGHDGRTVTLDQLWDVAPDETSIVSITMLQRHYLFIDNRFEDVGIGLQYYGTSIDHVASGNECRRGGGFYNSGRWYHHFEPSWYCQFLRNEILEGNSYRFGPNNATRAGLSFIGTYGVQTHGGTEPLALCCVHRGNHLHNNAQLRFRGYSDEHPGLRDVVAEHNVIENTPQGIYVGSGCEGLLLRDNEFTNCDQQIVTRESMQRQLREKREALIGQEEPVAYYSFDRAGEFAVADDSGHNFWANPIGAVKFERGVSGNAARFDGDGYFIVNDEGLLQFPRITICAWIRPDESKGRWGIVAKRSSNRSAPYVVAIRDGRLTFEGTDMDGEWSYNFFSKPVIETGRWHHLGAVCEEGSQVRLYCDGELVGTKEVDKRLVQTMDVLTIGYEAWGGIQAQAGQSGNFRGLIDEVKLWARALADNEIEQDYRELSDSAAADEQRRDREAAARKARLAAFKQRIVDPEGQNWQLVEADDFERKKLGERWKTLRGQWTIDDGSVRCSETSYLGYTREVGPPVRIEFDGRSDNPGDLTAFWGTETGAYKDGYFIGFASNGNTANKILRLGETVAQNPGPNATPGQWHHVIAQVRDGKVSLIVDGALVLEYSDPKPVVDASMAGLIAWSEGEFDNVRIYTAE